MVTLPIAAIATKEAGALPSLLDPAPLLLPPSPRPSQIWRKGDDSGAACIRDGAAQPRGKDGAGGAVAGFFFLFAKNIFTSVAIVIVKMERSSRK